MTREELYKPAEFINPFLPDPFENYTFPKSRSGHEPYPYQKEGVIFLIEQAQGRGMILDEMGLGKTIQAVLYSVLLKEYPVLIFCKPTLVVNWFRELIEWAQEPAVIIDRYPIHRGSNYYICSIDMAYRKRAEIAELGVKLMIVDECQNIKNTSTKRTAAIINISLLGNKSAPIPNVIGLTGTPIKNRATEFYPTLNMIRPDLFPTEADFVRRWTRVVWTSDRKYKEGGIRNLEAFNEYTKNMLIRRRRSDVLPDLPRVDRQNRFVDMDSANKAAYMKQYNSLQKFMNTKEAEGFEGYSTILQFISAMRQITAISKIPPAIDYINDFLEQKDSKITVFVHHHVAIKLMTPHIKVPFLRYANKSDFDNIEIFNKADGPRVLIASTLAAGEGLNLQYQCNTCLFLERQWNPANEEQAEGRFTRIGSIFDKVTAAYLIAIQTIDEWMTEIIEMKRVSADIDKEGKYNESDTIRQIASVLMKKGKPRWRLPRM